MESSKRLYLVLFGSLLAVSVSNWRIHSSYKWPFPALNELVYSDQYAGDIGVLMLGAHRLAGDIAYIQFLQYYGSHEEGELIHAHDYAEVRPKAPVGPQKPLYPLVKGFGLRIVELDPYFNSAVLEVAGVLGFNVRRLDESLSLLHEAILKDPFFYRYQIYVGAILYKIQGKDKELVRLLEEAIKYPDCPSLLETVLANLHIKFGNYERAAHIFVHMIETCPDKSDRADAKVRLIRLVGEHPSLLPVLGKDIERLNL